MDGNPKPRISELSLKVNLSEPEVLKDYTGRDYRTVWQKPEAKFEDRFEEKIIEQMMPTKLGWFIDVGGGYGRLCPQYTREGRKVVLVDYATNLLDMAAREYGMNKDIFFIAANAYHLPFQDEVFDAAITIRTFHHMNLPLKFFQEFSRVLRSRSEVLFEYSNKRNILRILKNPRRSLRKDHEDLADWQFGTHPAYLRDIAKEAGFEVERTVGTAFFPRFLTEKTVFLEPILAGIRDDVRSYARKNRVCADKNFTAFGRNWRRQHYGKSRIGVKRYPKMSGL